MKNLSEKIYVGWPQQIKYGQIFPIHKAGSSSLQVKFSASIKFLENPWPGPFISALISGISESDLKTLREIKDSILSSRLLQRFQASSFKLLQNGIIFAKFGKWDKIWDGDFLISPPMDKEMRGEIVIRFKHVFIGERKSVSCVLERFSWDG